MNERVTESFVREFYKQDSNLRLDEQMALEGASKNKEGNVGYPEFVITDSRYPDVTLLVECKKDISDHDKAIEEVAHYANFVEQENIVLLAVSGTDPFKVSLIIDDVEYDELLSFSKIIEIVKYDAVAELKTETELINYAKQLHNALRDNLALTEAQKPLLVSAVMIALNSPGFKASYLIHEQEDCKLSLKKRQEDGYLMEQTLLAVSKVLHTTGIPKDKEIIINNEFLFIESILPLYSQDENNHTHLFNIIKGIETYLFQNTHKYSDIDLIGKFYGEFIKYTGGDSSGLGIVLTPTHITDLMLELVDVNVDSVIYDPCCGTGGFLVTGMHKLITLANGDIQKEENIREKQLCGVELQSSMYTMAVANMIFKGDGKANIHNGSCFNLEHTTRHYKPTISILNPPYSQKAKGSKELDFLLHAAKITERGGKVVCIIPKSCFMALSNAKLKQQIMDNHTVEAVISCPNDLFYPVATNVAIIVLKANIPHSENVKTYFYDFNDDGFKMVLKKGRSDFSYEEKRDELLNAIDSKLVIAGKSAYVKIKALDEWIVDAYTEVDYSNLEPRHFAYPFTNEQIMEYLKNPLMDAN